MLRRLPLLLSLPVLLASRCDEPCKTSAWYADADADGYGDAASSLTSCEPLPG